MIKSLGVYGGAFDPPHLAHIALAQAAVVQLQLDTLLVMPTGAAWHKTRSLSAPEHRLAMAHLAFDGLAQVAVDPREMRRAGATYTIDTLQELQAEHPNAQLFLVMGQDQFSAFASWHRHEDIAKIATICIAARAHSTGVIGQFGSKKGTEKHVTIKAVHISMPPMPISATDIRARAAQGQTLERLVKPAVQSYIVDHRLYQNT